MAIDFLVGILLLCSASVNLLALGAFWVTPSLRNGLANRFTVNLLLVNLVCCIVLAPSLLLNSLTFTTEVNGGDGDFVNPTVQVVVEQEVINETSPTEVHSKFIQDNIRFTEFRSWGLDFVVAVGALSVLLVVSDTWCAVTDPLRYHTRLSDKKAWIAVALTWITGIIFGIASAFRSGSNNNLDPHDVYNMLYSYTYFVLAIFAPFCLICGMYWRIFTEARESGQRMRQNGSSPLLQSALNLAQVSAATAQQHVGGGLTMKIDAGTIQNNFNLNQNILISNINENNNKDEDNNNNLNHTETTAVQQPLLMTSPRHNNNNNNLNILNSENLSFNPFIDSDQEQQNNFNLSLDNKPYTSTHNHNILLTLTTSSSSEHIRRNLSAKHLVIENLDAPKKGELRHASSTPNLCKLDKYDLTPQLMLPLPQVHVPPKALSYMSSIRHRLSNASSLFKYREESRAARISILVVVMFLVSYLPYGILVLMQGHDDLIEASNQSLLAIFSVVLANLSSPFIFAYRNKRVRRGILRLLGVEKHTAERLQKFQNSTIRRKTTTFINLNRSTSRASTYSTNSCSKFLQAPHATTLTLNGSYIVEIDKLSPCYEESLPSPGSQIHPMAQIHGIDVSSIRNSTDNNNCKVIKKSILKRVCDTSKMLGCNCATNTPTATTKGDGCDVNIINSTNAVEVNKVVRPTQV